MKKLFFIFILMIVTRVSFADVMGKDRGGGNAAIAEFVQIMNLSLDMLTELTDRPLLKGDSDIAQLKNILSTMELSEIPNWDKLAYFQKIQVGFEKMFLFNGLDSVTATTNSLILAGFLEKKSTDVLERVFSCETSATPDGFPMTFIVALEPKLAKSFRGPQGLQKSSIGQSTTVSIGVYVDPISIFILAPNKYQMMQSILGDGEAKWELLVEVVGKKISGTLTAKIGTELIEPEKLKCKWE